jgi:hypothetical protein
MTAQYVDRALTSPTAKEKSLNEFGLIHVGAERRQRIPHRRCSGSDCYDVDRTAWLITLATVKDCVIIDRCPALT